MTAQPDISKRKPLTASQIKASVEALVAAGCPIPDIVINAYEVGAKGATGAANAAEKAYNEWKTSRAG